MIANKKPRVAVLLAAYNGEKYIEEQILSIIRQIDVSVHIYISIDDSTDQTEFICHKLNVTNDNITILNNKKLKFGSAGANFYHLFRSVDFCSFDFIALSDQDDIWKENKLARGVEVIKSNHLDGYSSDVECFWDNGKKKNKIIKKSYPQKKYDYFFEPAGPGCTYIISKNLATHLKKEIIKKEILPFHHDWYIYAYARRNNFKWHIDSEPNILYRQHENNQVGANKGLKQKIIRLKNLKSGKFKKEYIDILNSIGFEKKVINTIIYNPFDYRRNNKEALIIFCFFLFGWI